MDQMASVERSFGERMAFFWHGHICSELGKVESATAMREQIDLFRRRGLGPAADGSNVAELVKTMSIQVAMLRYLDNDQNFATSPNQNFARELMELFLLGVGNYTEADVEAATAAWTGHTRPRWDIDEYIFRGRPSRQRSAAVPRSHDQRRRARRGRQRHDRRDPRARRSGVGTIPAGAEKNRGRPSNEVAAEFLSYKLWQEFGEAASGTVPAGVAAAMRAALIEQRLRDPAVGASDARSTTTSTPLRRRPVSSANPSSSSSRS